MFWPSMAFLCGFAFPATVIPTNLFQDSDGAYEDDLVAEMMTDRFIVEKTSLQRLFRFCSVEKCGSIIDQEDVTFHKKGAAVVVKYTCLNHHEQSWLVRATTDFLSLTSYWLLLLSSAVSTFHRQVILRSPLCPNSTKWNAQPHFYGLFLNISH